MDECQSCGLIPDSIQTRLVQDSCGHFKCRLCLLQEENGCTICQKENNVVIDYSENGPTVLTILSNHQQVNNNVSAEIINDESLAFSCTNVYNIVSRGEIDCSNSFNDDLNTTSMNSLIPNVYQPIIYREENHQDYNDQIFIPENNESAPIERRDSNVSPRLLRNRVMNDVNSSNVSPNTEELDNNSTNENDVPNNISSTAEVTSCSLTDNVASLHHEKRACKNNEMHVSSENGNIVVCIENEKIIVCNDQNIYEDENEENSEYTQNRIRGDCGCAEKQENSEFSQEQLQENSESSEEQLQENSECLEEQSQGNSECLEEQVQTNLETMRKQTDRLERINACLPIKSKIKRALKIKKSFKNESRDQVFIKTKIKKIKDQGSKKDKIKGKIQTNRMNKNNISKENKKTPLKGTRRKRNHDWSHIITLPGTPVKYKCKICEKVFNSKQSKCYHASCLTGTKPYKCDICDKSFVTRSHYEYHERVHRNYKPFQCELCDASFVLQNKLNRHMDIHKTCKTIECDKCGKTFNRKEYLKNHMRVHFDDKQYKCNLCSKSFSFSCNLRRHQRSHSSDKPYKCDVCSKAFKTKFLLTRHTKTHSRDKPFSCHNCNRLFYSKFEIQRHMLVHSDDKPFSCQYCDTEFRRKDNLNRHIRHHHLELQQKELKIVKDKTSSANKCNIQSNCKDLKTIKDKSKVDNNEKIQSKSKELKIIKDKTKPANNDKIQSKSKELKILKNKTGIANNNQSNNKPLPKKPVLRKGSINSKFTSKKVSQHTEEIDQISEESGVTANFTSVIKSTKDVNNAVPVIKGPINIKKLVETEDKNRKICNYIEKIPLAEVLDINKQIEETIYPQNSTNYSFFYCNYEELAANQIVSNSGKSSTNEMESASQTSNQLSAQLSSSCSVSCQQEPKKDFTMHWRRRTAESLKPRLSSPKGNAI